MDSIEIKKYLSNAISLEQKKYELSLIEKNLKKFEDDILLTKEKEKIDYKKLDEQKNREIIDIKYKLKNYEPKEPYKLENPSIKTGIYGLVCLLVSIPMFLAAPDSIFMGTMGFFELLIGGAMLVVYLVEKTEYKQNAATYPDMKKKYDSKMKKYNNKLRSETDVVERKYDSLVKNEENKYNKKVKNIDFLKEKNTVLLDNIKKNIEVIDDKLKEFYSNDLIFEKYRNLIALTMFYEYFSSSRVYDLEGRDGAYNLYETEMRQNIIIVKLSEINENIEEIKQNQYCMYNEIKNINETLGIIDRNIDTMKNVLYNIDENVETIKEINSSILGCEKQINKNMKTLKNISIIELTK